MNTKISTGIVSICFILISATFSILDLEVKSFFEDAVELKIPKDFEVMSEEMLLIKYPSERRPSLVYTNPDGTINVALNKTASKADQSAIPLYMDPLVNALKNANPSAEWIKNEIININGRKVGYLELIVPAIDTDIYNLMFYTDVQGQLLLCTFNCTKNNISKWKPTAKEIMNSLKVN